MSSMFHASEGKTDNGSIHFTPKETITKRAHKGKLNKSDIGTPTNFKHVTHVGFNGVPGYDAGLEKDLKRLFNMAGVKEEHLQDQEVSRRIFSVLEKSGGMEAVRKQTRRMTSVERPNARSRLRSLSSSSLVPSKRQNSLEPDSPHATKVLARGSPLCYLPSLSRVPQSMETQSPFSHVPTMRPLPPMPSYLDELSHSFSPVVNLPVNHSKSARPLSTKNPMKLPSPPALFPAAKDIPSEMGGLPLCILDHPCPELPMNMAPLSPTLSHHDSPSNITTCKTDHLPSSIPCVEPPIKLGDISCPPPLPLVDKCISDAIAPRSTQGSLFALDLVFAAIPPPPPPPPLKFTEQSENPLSNESEHPLISQVTKTSNIKSKIQSTVASSKEPEQQSNPMFLDQIKQGVHLKSVAQVVKAENNTDCSNIVSALMDVIKKRHKAIQSSDEEEVEEDDWED